MRNIQLIIIAIIIHVTNDISAQQNNNYCFPGIDSLVLNEQYTEAIDSITENPSLTLANYYNLAICYSKLGELSKANKSLMSFIDTCPFSFISGIFLDFRIESLRQSGYWKNIDSLLIDRFLKETGDVEDTILSKKLFLAGIQDQKYRGLIFTQTDENCLNTSLLEIDSIDRKNMEFLDSIIQTSGWPTYTSVGVISASYAFYIMQHSGKKFLKKNLPLMEAAMKKGEADKLLWAKAYDRNRMYKNKKQVYGTQFRAEIIDGKTQPYELYKTRNRKNVNALRKEIGFKTTVEEELEKLNKKYNPGK